MPLVRNRGVFVFSAGIALLAAWALLQTIGWPIKAALYPRVVGIPLLLLAAAESLYTLRTTSGGVSEQNGETASDATVAPEVAARRAAAVAAWIGGLLMGVLLVGFQAAVPLFMLAYLRQARERWTVAVFFGLLAGLLFHLLFVSLLHLPLPIGLLWRALGR